jgi:hypothetical protein
MKTSFKILTVLLSLAIPVAANAQSSRWKMAEERDRMTDEMSYLAMTQARDSSQFVNRAYSQTAGWMTSGGKR